MPRWLGAVVARRSPAFIAGVSALVLFNAPLIWQSKSTGWHHLVLAAVLTFAAAGLELTRRFASACECPRWLAWTYPVLMALLLLPVTVVATNAYRPCAARVRARDDGADLEEWTGKGQVPATLRIYLERKRGECAAAP